MKRKYRFVLFLVLGVLSSIFGSQGYTQSHQTLQYSPATKDFLLGKTAYPKDTNFVVINKKFTPLSTSNAHIQKATYAAFLKMYDAALKDGVTLRVTSASRNYYIQRIIWEDKWTKSDIAVGVARVKSILNYNAIPGTSRHHWGSELDFCSPKISFWNTDYGKKVYKWLVENASKYGFYQPYSADKNRKGYKEEKWHWSYYPLSNIYTAAYKEMINLEDLKGFAGDRYISEINLIGDYVFGIENLPLPNPMLK